MENGFFSQTSITKKNHQEKGALGICTNMKILCWRLKPGFIRDRPPQHSSMSTHTTPAAGTASPQAEAGPHTQRGCVDCPWMQDCPHVDPSKMEVCLKTDSGTAYPGLSLRDNERTVHLTHLTPKTGICIL